MRHYRTKGTMSVTVFLFFLSTLLPYCNSQDFHCCDGAIRLSGGSLANEGRVEICQSGEWKTVCDNNWSENEARVVCRQLGYSDQGTVVPLLQAAYGQGTGSIVEHIRCSGTERQLTDCIVRDVLDGECTHSDDASVQCSCRTGDLRLQGSNVQGSGRVEVCINNVWGTICDNSWSSNDARVVCRQLGFSIIGASTSSLQIFGQGNGPIHIDNVRCTGSELSLIRCLHSRSHSCSHSDDAVVQCSRRIIECHDGDVRLVGGSQPHEGRVEVCISEVWGTICDYISPSSWNGIHQKQMLFVDSWDSLELKSTFDFGRGSLPIHMAYVHCRGYESNIGECIFSRTGSSSCNGYKYDIIGVQCISQTIKNGEVRLTNGLHKYAGRIEVYWNSEWRTVCYDNWDEFDAQVVCRQLNFLSTSVHVQVTSYEEYLFKTKGNSVQLTDVDCNNSENNLTSCCVSEVSRSLYCHSGVYAGVKCSQCVENSIQLYGELSQREGFVLICVGGIWGRIRRGSMAAATVVCRQLGFSVENPKMYHYDCYDGEQYYRLPYLLDRVECTSHEKHISQCNHSRSSNDNYFRIQFAVECQIAGETVPGEPQSVQVANTTSSIISMTWSPPLVSERHGLTIFGYIINCSTDHSSLGDTHLYTDIHNATLVNLHPFTAYNCCVAANSSNGRGRLACLRVVTLPSGVPTRLKAVSINSMSALVSWHAPDADEYSNGDLRQYYVEITDNSSNQKDFNLSDDSHLVFDGLKPGHRYTFRVAVYTTEKGPFSQPISITLPSLQGPLITALSSTLGLVCLALLIAVIIAVFLGYRLFRPWKKKTKPSGSVPVQAMPYEVVDVSNTQSNPSSTTVNTENHPVHVSHAKPLKRKKVGASHEYLNPPTIDSNQKPVTRGHTGSQTEKNTYQPLIPSRADEKPKYQSLTQKKGLTAPPAVPPKPEVKSSVL